MSVLGHKRTIRTVRFTSKGKRDRDVRFVPQADITERWQPGDSVRDHACKVAC